MLQFILFISLNCSIQKKRTFQLDNFLGLFMNITFIVYLHLDTIIFGSIPMYVLTRMYVYMSLLLCIRM